PESIGPQSQRRRREAETTRQIFPLLLQLAPTPVVVLDDQRAIVGIEPVQAAANALDARFGVDRGRAQGSRAHQPFPQAPVPADTAQVLGMNPARNAAGELPNVLDSVTLREPPTQAVECLVGGVFRLEAPSAEEKDDELAAQTLVLFAGSAWVRIQGREQGLERV